MKDIDENLSDINRNQILRQSSTIAVADAFESQDGKIERQVSPTANFKPMIFKETEIELNTASNNSHNNSDNEEEGSKTPEPEIHLNDIRMNENAKTKDSQSPEMVEIKQSTLSDYKNEYDIITSQDTKPTDVNINTQNIDKIEEDKQEDKAEETTVPADDKQKEGNIQNNLIDSLK